MGNTIRDKNEKRKSKVTISYEGKVQENEVFQAPYTMFAEIAEINREDKQGDEENLFFFGDNKEVLLYLLNHGYREKVDLIYIDPPFSTASDFHSRTQEHAYSDQLAGAEYVEFLRQRLIIMHALLAPTGSIYLHLDGKMAFTMKLVMDEVFGENNCRAFITRRKCSTKNYTRNTYGNISDYIMFYTKTNTYTWNRPYDSWDQDKMVEQYPYVDEISGRRYKKVPIHAPGIRNGETGKPWRGKLPPQGKHWQYTPAKLDELDAMGQIAWSSNGNPRRMVFCDPDKGVPVQDIWMNYRDSINQAKKTTGYPTEKNYEMLKMIVETSSNPHDLVMDCFAGSGTTLGAAFDLGRRWIGVDNSPQSLKAILKRFTGGLETYGDYVKERLYRQCSLDLIDKCNFQIWGLDELKKDVLNQVKSFQKLDESDL